jgi:hypothetical protein
MKNLHDFSESVAGLRYPMGGARSSFPHATNSHALYTYRESMVVVGHCGIVDNFVYFDPAVDKFGGFRGAILNSKCNFCLLTECLISHAKDLGVSMWKTLWKTVDPLWKTPWITGRFGVFHRVFHGVFHNWGRVIHNLWESYPHPTACR